MLVKTLVPGVVRKLRGRTDLTDVIPIYIKKAVIEFSQNYEFDELRYTGPLSSFTTGQSQYPINTFTQEGHDKVTFIVSWFCFFGSSGTIGTTFPPSTNNTNTGNVLKYRQPRVVENMSVIPGIPVVYTQVGEQRSIGNYIVGYSPNQNYATYMRYQIQHPFPEDSDPKIIAATYLYMPEDWQDIIEYAAAEKACDDIGMLEVGTLFHQKLYGNPSKRTPGLIVEKLSTQQRQSEYNNRQMRVMVRRY